MRIASEKTFQQFDKLKEQIYAHKRQTSIKPKKIRTPMTPMSLLPILLIGGGIWTAYKIIPKTKEYLVDNKHITYQQNLVWNAMEMYFKCRWKSMIGTNQSYNDKYLANRCYLTNLESDFIYLNEKSPQKKLSIQARSKLSFWIIGITNQQKIRYINQYGDLLEKNRSSKIMIGDFIRIWTNCSQTLLQHQKIFSFYLEQFDSIGKSCEKVNLVTKMQFKPEEYDEALKQCNSQSQAIKKNINKLIEYRLANQKKKLRS